MILAAAAEIIGQWLSGTPAGNALTVDDVAGPFSNIEGDIKIIDDVFASADSASTAAVTAATDAAQQVERIGQDVKDVSHRIIDVILPHSMSWLDGYVVSNYITPLRIQMRQVQSDIRFILGWRSQIDTWRHKFVDPNVELWIGFRKWFDTWPRNVVYTVHGWLEKPHTFGEWAAAPVTGPVIAYLAQPEHGTSRDNLSLIMLHAMSERPEDAWDGIVQWLVSNR